MAIPHLAYTQIPNIFIDEYLPKLSANAAKIFLIICRKTIGWHKEADRISNMQLMLLSGIKSRVSLVKAIKELCTHDLIVIEREGCGKKTKTYYEIKFSNTSENDPLTIPNTSENDVLAPINTSENDPTKDININKKEKKCSSFQKAVDERMLFFNEFWEKYPRRQGRAKAELKWKSKGCSAKAEQILDDIEFRLKNISPNGWLEPRTHKLCESQYIQLPETYLNQERWDDEYVEVRR